MFTGIITDVGTIEHVETRGDLRVRIATRFDMESVDMGASIACSGACLTVVGKGPGWFEVDISSESVACTAPNLWKKGERLNLERALKLGDELGGHIVTGHVDGIARIVGIEKQGDSQKLTFRVGRDLAPYIAPKGSITLDGISLTVNSVTDGDDGFTDFSINVIPHTAQYTTFDTVELGRAINVEIDVLARYLKRMNDTRV